MSIQPVAVLAELSAERAVSGRELAARLGVTRAAVWKQVERLRALGLPVTASVGGGYRLPAPVELLERQAILAALPAPLRRRLGDLALHWELDSTSSELLRRVADDPRDLQVCLAEIQTHGRGRRGRAWQMPLAGGLALSLLKRFEGGMGALAGLSLAVGVALIRAFADCGVVGVGLKWPNDTLAGDRKLAGILIESGGDWLGPCHVVIGIGINIRLGAAYAARIDQPWTDLAALIDPPPSRNALVARLLARLIQMLDVFAAEGFAAFADEYARHDALRDQAVRVSAPDGVREGIAAGVDTRGALRVRTADGMFSVESGEVSVRRA